MQIKKGNTPKPPQHLEKIHKKLIRPFYTMKDTSAILQPKYLVEWWAFSTLAILTVALLTR